MSTLARLPTLPAFAAAAFAAFASAQEPWPAHSGVSLTPDAVIFELSPEQPLSLLQFVELANQVEGQVYSLDSASLKDSMRPLLAAATLDLVGRLSVPRSAFGSFVGQQLRAHGLTALSDGSGTIRILPDDARTRGVVKEHAVALAPEEVHARAGEPCLFVMTIVRLRHAMAQSIGVNLRTALGVAGVSQEAFMPMPAENALLVQGYAPFVAQSLELIESLDVPPDPARLPAAAREAPAPPASQAEAAAAPLLDERTLMWASIVIALLLLASTRLQLRALRRDLRSHPRAG